MSSSSCPDAGARGTENRYSKLLWPTPIAAIVLGVTPDNVRARRLYERLGFVAAGISMVRPLP
jgi:ribosomal protein S18 acetylase RimI-like enzyme